MADKSPKCKTTSFVSLIVVTCVEMVTLIAIVIVWRHDRSDLRAPTQQTLCYRWDRFVPADAEETCPVGLKTIITKNITNCCGNSSSVLDKLISQAVSEKYNNDANPEAATLNLTEYNCVTATRQPTAKLVGIAHEKKPVLVGSSSKVFWNSNSPSYSTSGLQHLHDDGTINVKSPGFYFVTAQIKFTLEIKNSTNDVKENTFRHYVHLISSGGIGSTILEDAKLQCEMASAIAEFTSNVGAVFRLDDGDRLYVATSHPHLLVTDDRGSYFSMYKF